MDINTAFKNLHGSLGSHSAAAKFLGITPQHYTALRNGRANIPQRTADYIILKALELEFGPTVVPQRNRPAKRVRDPHCLRL